MNMYDYLFAINCIAFLLYLIHVRMHHANKVMQMIINLLCVAGGALGVIGAILCFDRKAKKENMMTRVLASCMLVMQIVLIMLLKKQDASFNVSILSFFLNHRYFLYYIGMMNILTFLAFGLDKWKAKHASRRIPIVTLLGLSALGGSIGGIVAMFAFRHKTRKDYFRIGLPIILITQVMILLFIMNC